MIRFTYDGPGIHRFKPFADTAPTAESHRDLLREMLHIRMVEEAIEREYHNDQMKTPIHLAIGQEATSVGVCAALTHADPIYCTHRTHGVYLAKGGDLKAMLAEMYCRKTGCVGSRGGSMHLMDRSVGMLGSSAIVAGAVPVATGFALSAQLKKTDTVSTVFFGDAASEEGAVWEALNFAALRKLPMIYICENNYYSVCSPLTSRQPENVDIYKKAESFGLAAEAVDGTNVLAVLDATRRAVTRAKAGEGPTFIESRAYRWRGHGGAGDDSHTGYRDPEEVKAWQEWCPIENYHSYLCAEGIFDDAGRDALVAALQTRIADAMDFAQNSPPPDVANLHKHLFSE